MYFKTTFFQKFNNKGIFPMIFVFLIGFGILIFLVTLQKLPETLTIHQQKLPSLLTILCQLAKDPKVIGFGLLVALCNGITFSYYAEGSFYLIELLGLSPSQYGMTFALMASATIAGSVISRKTQSKFGSITMIK
jgi:predicted MFS family arabinose efflux permease